MKIIDRSLSYLYLKLFTEEQLIFLLCKLHLCHDPIDLERIKKTLNKKINWVKMVRLIQINKLWMSVIDWQKDLNKYNIQLPHAFVEQCNAMTLPIQYYREVQQREARNIFQLLSRNEVKFVVMKSFVLSFAVQWKVPKISCDIDLLIPPSEFKKAAEVLMRHRYKYIAESNQINRFPTQYLDFYLAKSQERFQGNRLIVEIHSSIVDTYDSLSSPWDDEVNRSATQELYQSARKALFFGSSTKIFPTTELIISLFLHSLFQHNLQGGSQYLEIAFICNQYRDEINWEYIFKFMKKYKIMPYFLWFVCLLRDSFNPYFPNKVQNAINLYRNKLRFLQIALFYIMKYKILNPTRFSVDQKVERQKKWSWMIIDNRIHSLIIDHLIHTYQR
jgi:hypothetical protein